MGSNIRSLAIVVIISIAALFISSNHAIAQACQCEIECPAAGYTKCWEGWTSTNMVPMTIYIPIIQTYCNVEVRYCCRTRSITSAQCQSFVTGPIGASCETAITCIKIPKECIGSWAPNGQPITNPLIRKQIYYAVLEQLICMNPCQHGLPGPGEDPYEWVFSMPACVEYLKTGGPMTAFCLNSCGSRYCVYAFKVIASPNQDFTVKVLETVVETWSSAIPPYCEPNSTGCVTEDCDTEYRPSCSDWEYN